jgi:predicted phage tail protein
MTTCLRKLKLYGDLAEHLEVKEIEIDVATVAKSIQCLLAYHPKAESYMMNRYYRILVDERPTELEELHYPAGRGDIKIVPVITGESGRGLGSILLGAVFIGAAIFAPGAGFAFGEAGIGFMATGAAPSAFMAAVGNIGIALVLGGISQMLTPTPETPEEDPENSFAFNSPVNTARAGLAIPLIYGERLVGSAVISAGIRTEKVVEE